MTEETKLTIIMPVYNAGKYLKEAIESVLAQEETSYELWCIDDASEDSSYGILQEYQKIDDRIKIFRNEERKGAPYSRNRALEQVHTPYVMFLDADDVFDPMLIRLSLEAIEKNNADVAYYEWDKFLNENVAEAFFLSDYPVMEKQKEYVGKPHQLYDLCIKNALSITNGVAFFVFRTALIQENQLEFQMLSSRNDVYFIEMAKMCAKKMVHVDTFKPLYHQRIHNAPTRIGNNPKLMNLYKALKHIKEGMAERKLDDKYMGYFMSRYIESAARELRECKVQEQRMEFLDVLRSEGLAEVGISKESVEICNIPMEIKELYQVLVDGSIQEIEQTNLFKESLKVHKNKVERLFDSWSGKKVAFWGVGQRMRDIQELFADRIDFSVMYLDAKKYGDSFANQVIQDYAQVVNQNDLIVISNHTFEGDVRKRMVELGGREELFVFERYIESEM